MTAVKNNPKIQAVIVILDALAVFILGPITLAWYNNSDMPFFNMADALFENFTVPIIVLSLFTVISAFFINMKKNSAVFIPIYILDLICVLFNPAYLLWIVSAIFGFV